MMLVLSPANLAIEASKVRIDESKPTGNFRFWRSPLRIIEDRYYFYYQFKLLIAPSIEMFVNPTLVWLVAGAGLCLAELFLPTAFVAFMMGISAFLVALVSLIIPNLSWQVILWLVVSTSLVLLSRRFVPKAKKSNKIRDAIIAETLTEIAAGKAGRVIYEGNSWRARCDDTGCAIAPHQKVYVVRREGTTLIVVPENLLHS